MRFDGTYLFPASPDSIEVYSKLKQGDEYMVTTKRARNPGHHRKAFALLKQVFENQEKYETMNDLLTEFKLQCGHYKEHISLGGRVVYNPLSISFEEMEQDDFNAFYNRMIDVAIKYFNYEGAAEFV